jgi:predicted amidohydrolase
VKSVGDSEYVLGLQKEAKENRIAINVGIHEPGLKGGKKIRNTSLWISAEGEIVQRYQKLHLFEMHIENGPQAREAEWVSQNLVMAVAHKDSAFEKGMDILPPFLTPVGKVGLMICFDVGFTCKDIFHVLIHPSFDIQKYLCLSNDRVLKS